MAYNANKPAGNDPINSTAADFRENFTQIKTLVDKNHETFESDHVGKHKYVSLREQGAAPATAASEMALYVKDNAGTPNVYFRQENDGVEFNLMDATAASPGSTRLPSGIIMKWGFGTINAGSITSAAINFVSAFTNNCWIVNVTPRGLQAVDIRDAVLAVNNVTVNSFYVTRNNNYKGTARNFYYMAIGN